MIEDVDRLMKLIIIGTVLSLLGAGSWASREYSHWKDRRAWKAHDDSVALVVAMTDARFERERERRERAEAVAKRSAEKAQQDSAAAASARDSATKSSRRADSLARRIRQERDSADLVLVVLDDSIRAWAPKVVVTAYDHQLELERTARADLSVALVKTTAEAASERAAKEDAQREAATATAEAEAARDAIAARDKRIESLEQKPERPSRFKEGVGVGAIVTVIITFLLL